MRVLINRSYHNYNENDAIGISYENWLLGLAMQSILTKWGNSWFDHSGRMVEECHYIVDKIIESQIP